MDKKEPIYSFFASNPLPLPPKEEQSFIVMKVDELMTICDQLEQEQASKIETHNKLINSLLNNLNSSTTNA